MCAVIKHKWVVPKETIYAMIDKINKTKFSFGVHKEDNNAHERRDKIQQNPLHKLTYPETKPISNAELLAKTESGSIETWVVDGELTSVEIPPRPVLKPCFDIAFKLKGKKAQRKDYIAKAIGSADARYIADMLVNLGEDIDLIGFVEQQRETNAKWQNSPVARAVKKYDREYSDLFKEMPREFLIAFLKEAEKEEDLPNFTLTDSADLLNSIKYKVTQNGV